MTNPHPYLLPGALAMTVAFAMALYLITRRHATVQSRLLAGVLVLEGTAIGITFAVAPFLAVAAFSFAARGVEYACQISLLFLYPAFLGTIDSPFSRPFRARPVRIALLAAALSPFLLWPFLSPWMLSGTVVHLGTGPGPIYQVGGWLRPSLAGALYVDLLHALVLFYGLLVAVTAMLRTRPGSLDRTRAVMYTWAFGVRELLVGTALLLYVASQVVSFGAWRSYVTWFGVSSGLFFFVLLLGYGFLKTQLFDIDLKIKWTVKKGTLAAIFLLVFFVTAQVAQAFLTTEYGWAIGGVVAGLLFFAIAPLQRFAERLSDAAMPRVVDTEEYRGRRKEDVYRATLEEMLVDGSVSVKERRILMRLQEDLGLDPGLALRLEKEIMDRGVA